MMALPLLVIPLTEAPMSAGDRLLAAVAWATCLFPAWHYLGLPDARRPPIPFLPFIGFEFAVFFAVQGVVGSTNVYGRFDVQRMGAILTPEMYSRPIFLFFCGITLLLVGYYATAWIVRVRKPRVATEYAPRDLAKWAFRILVFGIVVEIVQRLSGNPMIVRGLLYFGGTLSLLSLSLLTILAVRRQLSRGQTVALILGASALLFLRAGTSATAQLVMIALAILFSVWIAGGRISARWLWVGALASLLFISIRGVANDHRKNEAFAADQLPMLQRSTLLFTLLAERVEREGITQTVVGGWESVAGRAALLDLFTDVYRQTPELVPYWNGETYISLIGAIIPRFLWPDKPAKLTGYLFGQRYHYLARGDYSTTINLPYFIEFYANFGEIGILLGMVLVGVIYRLLERIVNVPGQSILRTVVGMGILLPLINIESDFSLVFGGLFLTGIALWAVYRVAGKVVRGRLTSMLPVAVRADGGGAGRSAVRHAVPDA